LNHDNFRYQFDIKITSNKNHLKLYKGSLEQRKHRRYAFVHPSFMGANHETPTAKRRIPPLRTKTSIGFFIAIRKTDQSFRKYQFHKTTDCDYIAG